MDRTLVFVYGTLKRGFPNHGLLETLASTGDAAFVAAALTADPFPLVVGPNSIPFLLLLPGLGGHRISGDLYSASAAALARLDDLEGVDRGHYQRLPIKVEIAGDGDGEGEEVEAMAYFADRGFGEEMWTKSGEKGIRVYTEAMALEYVKPSDRPRGTTFLGEIRKFLSSSS